MQLRHLVFFSALACTGSAPKYSGFPTYSYFAFDGVRSWTYFSEATEAKLDVYKGESIDEGSIVRHIFEYSDHDSAELLMTVSWEESNGQPGIRSITIGEETTDYSTPVMLAAYPTLTPGGSIVSELENEELSSTFNSQADCSNDWNRDQEWLCLHFTLTSSDENSSVPVLGDWWMSNPWGPSWFQTTTGPLSDGGKWVLAESDYSGN